MSNRTIDRAQQILSGWLSGAATAGGANNPAGPLYVGGEKTETALTDPSEALYSRCSSCSGSGGSFCC